MTPCRGSGQVHSGPPPEPHSHRGSTPVSAPPAQAVHRRQPQPTRLNRGTVAYLQRAAGNQAIKGLLAHPPASSTAVQRDVENQSFKKGIDAADKERVEAFFAAFNDAVKVAYEYVISVPSLGAWVGLDGHTKKLMAATFGYVIESLVSGDTEYRPSAPAGCTVLPQVVSGGTRPDLVLSLKQGARQIAWLDLTASGSVDHIYDKDNWDQKIGTFAEVTYPSLDPGTLAFMMQNKDNKGVLTKEEFEERQKKARAAYIIRKRHWVNMGKEKYSVGKHKRALAKIGSMNIQLNPSRKQPVIKDALQKDFRTTIDNKMIPSILRAMGMSPGTWGFDTGYSESERAGEAWLVDNDPTLPSSPEPEDRGGVAAEDRRPGGGRMTTERADVRAKPY